MPWAACNPTVFFRSYEILYIRIAYIWCPTPLMATPIQEEHGVVCLATAHEFWVVWVCWCRGLLSPLEIPYRAIRQIQCFFLSLSRHILLQVNGKVETTGFMSWTSCLQCWYLPNCHLSHHLVEVTALLSIHGLCGQHSHCPWWSLNLRPSLSAA